MNNGATKIKMAPGGTRKIRAIRQQPKRKHQHSDADCQNQLNCKQVFRRNCMAAFYRRRKEKAHRCGKVLPTGQINKRQYAAMVRFISFFLAV